MGDPFAGLIIYRSCPTEPESRPNLALHFQLGTMIQERLNDAAIALHRVLSREQVTFGIFGGYAVATLGGPRESKDVDCIASVSKDQIIRLLNNKEGFQVIPQGRQDYVAFFWSDRIDRSNAVLVEIFCEKFPGKHISALFRLSCCCSTTEILSAF